MGVLRKLFRATPTHSRRRVQPVSLGDQVGHVIHDGLRWRGLRLNAYVGPKNRVLMICTEERNMTMANGKNSLRATTPSRWACLCCI